MRYQGSSEYEANAARDRRIGLTPMAVDDGSPWNPWNPWWLVVGALSATVLGALLR